MDNKNSVFAKVYRNLISSIVNLLAKENNNDIANTILIVGSTRSGTTYLMENINDDNEYRLIFEPFNNTYTEEWKSFETRHYINPDRPTKIEISTIQKILSGNINNKWVDRFNRKIRSDKRLIKAVRANFLVEYIRKAYPSLPIIYLVRDVYEVVASRINMNFDPIDLDRVLSNSDLMKIYYPNLDIDIIKELAPSKEAKHAALWCLENKFLLKIYAKLNLQLLYYDDIKGMSVKLEGYKISLNKKVSKPSASSALTEKYQLNKTEMANIKLVLEHFEME